MALLANSCGHAHGASIRDPVIGNMDFDFQKGFGHGITLLRFYNGDEISTVILELAEEVCRRTRQAKNAGSTVHFGLGYLLGRAFWHGHPVTQC